MVAKRIEFCRRHELSLTRPINIIRELLLSFFSWKVLNPFFITFCHLRIIYKLLGTLFHAIIRLSIANISINAIYYGLCYPSILMLRCFYRPQPNNAAIYWQENDVFFSRVQSLVAFVGILISASSTYHPKSSGSDVKDMSFSPSIVKLLSWENPAGSFAIGFELKSAVWRRRKWRISSGMSGISKNREQK